MILQSKVTTCDICQRRNGKMAISSVELHPVPAWHHVAMDFIGPLTSTPLENKLVYIRIHMHIYMYVLYIYTYTYMCIYIYLFIAYAYICSLAYNVSLLV